jgi:2-desacetyl-2-hydroxyethyl bacteriochlorophyllide A dehydrogenase
VLGIQGRDGVHAERFLLPAVNLVPVPDELPDQAAVFAEPVAAALEVLDQVPGLVDREVLVLGDGRLGLLLARVLRAAGTEVSVLGRHPAKLSRLQADGIPGHTAPEAVAGRYTAVVEATGKPEGFQTGLAALQPRGTIILKSTYRGEVPLPMSSLVVDEVTLVGSRCGRIDRAIDTLTAGNVRVEDLVDMICPLARAAEGYSRAMQPDIVKVLLEP